MYVFVLDNRRRPLDPCHPAKARKLLASGRASVFRRYPFTIIIHDLEIENCTIHDHQLKIDPGAKYTGFALLRSNQVIWGCTVEHRGFEIRDRLTARRAFRRGRRKRKTRYRRPPNHEWFRQGKKMPVAKHRRTDWLPPSLMSRVSNILTWVKRFCRFCPISGLSQELVKFDTQKIQNPEISGVQYQQGVLQGYEVREYLLEKWHRKCAYCGATNTRLEIEHIKPRSRGGSNRVNNLTLACVSCNQAKGNRDLKDFLSGQPDLILRIQTYKNQPLADATAVNATRWKLYEELNKTGLPVETGTGGRTKYNRQRLKLEKTHWLDAACVGKSTPDNLQVKVTKPLQIKAQGWGSREMTQKNKYGFPRLKKNGLQMVKSRSPVKNGFRTGDIVQAIVPTGKHQGVHVGKVTVRASGAFDLTTATEKRQSIRWKYCTALHCKDGYSYS